MRNFLEWAKDSNLQGVVGYLNPEKGVDVLKHENRYSILDECRLSPAFQNMAQSLYRNTTSPVLVSGEVSFLFEVSIGVRKGCPLSRTLNVLSVDPVLQQLSTSVGILKCRLLEGHKCIPTFASAHDLMLVVPSDTTVPKFFGISELL